MPNEQDKKATRPLPKQARQPDTDEQSNASPFVSESDFPVEDQTMPRSKSTGVPVVGMGASAGGIEILARFFDVMPANSGAAFVIVLHLDPTNESQLASILASHTPMPVAEIEDGMVVAPDHVYVIAPNHDLTLDGDTLRLIEPSQPRGQRHPVDVLFASLAEQRRERTAAIVLSGTGTNGTQGLKEVKAAGGLILIQDPAEARFDGMPRSAIGAGLADHVLAAADMPEALRRYFEHGYVTSPDSLEVLRTDEQPELVQLLGLLRAHSGQEFRSYKTSTLLRRINRRMSLKGLTNLGSYLDLLRADPGEVQALVRDLLINVTSFFRDAEAWATLDEVVITEPRRVCRRLVFLSHAAMAGSSIWA